MNVAPEVRDVVGYFLRLGCLGFGGPVALANAMRRDLVDRRGWLTAYDYDEGLAIATACPGPLAYQLGVYCGYVTQGYAGAVAAALAFAAGPFAIVVAVAYLYVRFGSTWELQALFFGIAPVVVALIAKSCWDLGKKTLRGQWPAYAVAAVATVITIVVQQELIVLFLAAGMLGIFIFSPLAAPASAAIPRDRTDAGTTVKTLAVVPVGALSGVANTSIFLFFFQTGFLVFGSGLVVVPFLKAFLVDRYHWLSEQSFLDAVAIGIISPGPVVITATFVGYLLNGFQGALAATAGMFAPSVIFVILGTPLLRRHRRNRRLQGFIRGITVAVVGVLVGTSFLIARSSIAHWFSATVCLIALMLLFSRWKIPEQALIVAGGALGILAFTSGVK